MELFTSRRAATYTYLGTGPPTTRLAKSSSASARSGKCPREVLDWLVAKWQWPAATLFAACFLAVLAPMVFHYAGTPLGLVYLQLPIYMLHQFEEHRGDRFRIWVNRTIGHGREVLTPIATFWINSLLVWGLDLVALYLACFVSLWLGLIAIYMPIVNGIAHVVPAIINRRYNPGLVTGIVLFLPVGVTSAVIVSVRRLHA